MAEADDGPLGRRDGDRLYLVLQGPMLWPNETRAGINSDKVVSHLLAHADAKELNLQINSTGGNPYAAAAIVKALQNHAGRKTTVARQNCFSAAFDVFLVGDVRIAERGTTFLVHAACYSPKFLTQRLTAAYLRSLATKVEEWDQTAFAFYSERTGISPDVFRKLDDLSFDVDVAMTLGVVHQVLPS